MAKKVYKIGTGIWKSIKNTLIVWGIPTLVLFIDNWTEIIPVDYQKALIPVIGLIAYFVKNYIQNK